jgi:hypothetical protein
MNLACICEWCGQLVGSDEPRMNTICIVKHKDNLYEFGITSCGPCFGVLKALPRDLQDRTTFPDGTQVALYKVKKYLHPTKKKDKKIETWKLFSPLRTRGKKVEYS